MDAFSNERLLQKSWIGAVSESHGAPLKCLKYNQQDKLYNGLYLIFSTGQMPTSTGNPMLDIYNQVICGQPRSLFGLSSLFEITLTILQQIDVKNIHQSR